MASTNSNYFQLYLASCVALAQTIIVKSTESEQGLNTYISTYYGASALDTLDPTSWKYYMNLAGEYHPTDTMMTVISLDTMEEIDFTVANLKIHTATAAAYVFGTSYYQALVSQYPTQVQLILGILYPVDINTAINAADGTILGYPAVYVEQNEYSLIQKLQTWIYSYKQRWMNPQFGVSDELYFTVQLANMYYGVFQAIIAYREQACGTAEMHSFHQQQYLASHQGLDQYLDQLTLEQSIWLCRNIDYVQRNVGKASTFQTLIDNVLTPREIPLAAYTMRHDVSAMPTQTYPTVVFESDPLNFDENLVASTTWTLDTMLTTEQPLASMNALIQSDVESDIQIAMENSLSNTLKTKVLNSAMVDETDSSPYTLENTLMNHWLFFSAMDWYTAFLVVDNPVSGEPIVPMNAKDGFVFMWYCYSKSIGIELMAEPLPSVMANRVIRLPQPSIADVMSVVDSSLVTQDIATQALSYLPALAPMISTESFYETGNLLWQAANNQRGLVSQQEHYMRRGMVYGMVERCWSDNMIQLGDTGAETFAQWFALRNLDLSNFTANDYGLMYDSLVQAATGINLNNTNSIANLQAAMVGIMQKLSSYSVQYLHEINESAIKDIDWPMVRVGDVDLTTSDTMYDEEAVDTFNVATSNALGLDYDAGEVLTEVLNVGVSIEQNDSIAADVWLDDHSVVIDKFINAGVYAKSATPLTENSAGIVPVIGLDAWLALPLAQQEESMVSIYSKDWNNSPTAPVAQMASVWPTQNLTGLTYTPPSA